MKTFLASGPCARRLAAAAIALAVTSAGWAAAKKNPTSKLYVADLQGEAQIDNGERIEDLTKKSVHTAQGTVIETKPNSENAMVFSNGAGVFFGPDTRMEVRRFVQEPFSPNRTDIEVEPSISQTMTYLSRGVVGLCTSRMVAGSTMVYSTPHASVNVRGNKVLIQSSDIETKISLVEGDVTVRAGEGDSGGQILRAGQQAIIRRPPGQAPIFIVQPIPAAEAPAIDNQVSMACMARQTVYFEVAERDAITAFDGDDGSAGEGADDDEGQDLVPVEVVPTKPSVEVTVSAKSVATGGALVP